MGEVKVIQVREDGAWVAIKCNTMLTLMVKHKHKNPKATEFKIGNIIYKIGDEVTDEVQKAFKKAKMWEKLKEQ